MSTPAQRPRTTGRPTSLTPEVEDRIVTAIRGGSYIDDAASFAGVSDRTVYNWLARGKDALYQQESGQDIPDSEHLYLQFLQSVQRARSEAVLRNLALIQTAAQNGSWQAAAWYLERTNPRKWGRHETVELEGIDRDTPIRQSDVAALLDERIARMRERSTGIIDVVGRPDDGEPDAGVIRLAQ